MALTKQELYSELRQPEKGMRPFTRAGNNLNLAPTLTGHGNKSDAYKRGGMEYHIASLPEIHQQVIRPIAQKALYRAQGILGTIRAAAFSFGDIREHWVNLNLQAGHQGTDYYLILTDQKNGHKGAMSIEYGRGEYELTGPDGETRTIGAMTGKFILHRALGVAPNSLRGTGGGSF